MRVRERVDVSEIAWSPSPERIAQANVTRLARKAGVADIDALREWSVRDLDAFWDLVVQDLGLPFDVPYTKVRDEDGGIARTTWFTDGRINVATACVDRWRDDPATRDQPALVHEAEDGTVTTLTYAQLADEVDRAANGLRAAGIEKGDAVAVFLPMVCESVVAAYAIAKVGALYMPLFSGFAPGAIASRLDDAQAQLVITADWAWRRGARGPMKAILDEALADAPSVHRVVVVERDGTPAPPSPRTGRDMTWAAFTSEPGPVPTEPTAAEDVLLLGYTSGTTGKPKGAVHTHAGFLVKVASELAYAFDLKRGDVFSWITDMGWIMGPLSTFGTHALGATLVLYEGAPDFPDHGRLWQLAERHRITVLGVSPTLIRALKPHGDGHHRSADLSSVQVFGSTGEPWNDAPYRWLATTVGGNAVPIINFSGGTEVGGSFLSPYVTEEIAVCSLGGPSLGMDVDVFDKDGNPVVGELGELVCKQAWPAMTRGVWGDPDRFYDSYWSMYDCVWRHGDWAMRDASGQWYVLGRSDEAINVAGKRVGPAEVESVLVAHDAVAEAAVIGVPDETKGEAIWCFWTPTGAAGTDVSEELRQLVGEQLGKPFLPGRVIRLDALPKTRTAKVMRRAIRATAIGADPGDLSGAENPEALALVRAGLTDEPVPA